MWLPLLHCSPVTVERKLDYYLYVIQRRYKAMVPDLNRLLPSSKPLRDKINELSSGPNQAQVYSFTISVIINLPGCKGITYCL